MLGTLKSHGAPEAVRVSFELETDEKILIIKVGQCLAQVTRF